MPLRVMGDNQQIAIAVMRYNHRHLRVGLIGGDGIAAPSLLVQIQIAHNLALRLRK